MTTTIQRKPPALPHQLGSAPVGGPRWRELLEARWQSRLLEVTELSLAFHDAAAARDQAAARQTPPELIRLMRRLVEARRALADTDEALGRLAAGRFGRCEFCLGAITRQALAAAPETRYCPRCDRAPGSGSQPGSTGPQSRP
jgi:RNA polymerase-binding transcription factor DksA